jgi:ABC-type dipeptide/oligopeptide/nickel transport system permease component
MVLYLLRRLVSIAITFFIVSVIIFLMMHAVPGGPFDGNDMPVSEAVRAKLMARLGLDQPLWVQYVNYMLGVLQFDFGVPYQSPGETVLSLLAHAWPPSLILGGLGVLIGAPRRYAAIPGSTTSPRRCRRSASPSRSSSFPCC